MERPEERGGGEAAPPVPRVVKKRKPRGRGAGNRNGPRKEFAKKVRRRAVARLYAQDVKEVDIARTLGVSQKTVSRDVQIVTAEVIHDTKHLIAGWREEQIKRLEGYRDDLLAEWHRSKGNAKVTRQEMAVGPPDKDGKPSESGKRVSITTAERVADPRFMEKLLGIEDMIAKLRGTYAPTKVSQTDPDGNSSPILEGNVLVINVDARNS